MAREYITLGPTPPEEDCAQVGADDYHARSAKESRAWINQLKRAFPNLPDGVRLHAKNFPHDFGSYVEVVASWAVGDEAAMEAAYNIDAELPGEWDDEARRELELV